MPFPLASESLGLLSFVLAVSGSPSHPKPPRADAGIRREYLLEAGHPANRQLSRGEIHSYRISLDARQYVRLVVDQQGVDVALTLFAPDRSRLFEVDNPNRAQLPEIVSLITRASGRYILEVRAARQDIAGGRYSVKIEENHPSTRLDARRIEAAAAFAKAEELRAEGDAASLHGALTNYERAAALWAETRDPAYEAEAIVSLGVIHSLLDENEKALEQYGRALQMIHAAEAGRAEARSLTAIGDVYNSMGERQKALDFFGRALPLWRATGYHHGLADTLNDIGYVHGLLGDRETALRYYREALPLWRGLGERVGEAFALTGIGKIEDEIGDRQGALDTYGEALSLARIVKERRGEGAILNNMGLIYASLGENATALQYFLQALPVRREVGHRAGEVATLTSLGTLYDGEGEKEKALEYFHQAMTLSREIKDPRGQGVALTRLGSLYDSLGDKTKAIDFQQQALELRRRLGDPNDIAAVLTRLGALHHSLGDNQVALGEYREALALAQAAGYRKGEAELLYRLAQVSREQGDLAESRRQIEEGLRIIESLRARVTSADLRATYLATARDVFEFDVDLLMQMHRESPAEGFDALALEASERSRARALLEFLTESGVDVRQGAEPKLLEQERSTKLLLSGKLERQMRLLSRDRNDREATKLGGEIQKLKAESERIDAEIRSSSPRYAALMQPQLLDLATIRREALDGETILLEYFLGQDVSFGWAVTRDSLRSFELPGRARVEELARRLYDHLVMPGPNGRTGSARNQTRSAKSSDTHEEGLPALSEMLLGPASDLLEGRRLLIVAEGALQYVPFAALPISNGSETVPLVALHEVVSAPSASVVAILRRENRTHKRPSKTVAVLADPVFEKDDERVTGPGAPGSPNSRRPEVAANRIAYRSAAAVGLEKGGRIRISRLPYSRREAQSILSLVPPEARMKALDFEANRAKALSSELGDYRFVHFATHGFLNSVRPELSGILLSLVDKEGRETPGYLSAADTFNMRLPVDLVVLSGCQTALGREIRGEGLIGLARGLMYAGARGVVASLWKVSDAATAELMRRFYSAMLRDGLTPAAALRRSQLDLSRSERWRDPAYWAAFVLQGDWRSGDERLLAASRN